MNKIYRFVFVLIFVLGLLQGCGNNTTNDRLKKYDIREYIAPIENKVLKLQEYQSYNSSDPSESENTYSGYLYEYMMTDGLDFNKTTKYDSGYELAKSNAVVTDSNITIQLNDSVNMPQQYNHTFPRYADISDTVVSSYVDYNLDGYRLELNTSCILTEHLEKFEVNLGGKDFSFDDVLKQECTTYKTTYSTSIPGAGPYYEVDKFIDYYAKHLGTVYSVNRDCNQDYRTTRDDKTECPGGEEYAYMILDINNTLNVIETEDINFTVLQSSQYSDSENHGKVFKLIKTQDEYENEMARYTDKQPAAVDFEKNYVVLADIGTRPDSSYNMEISSVYKDTQGDVHVSVLSKEQKGECVANTVITNPHAFIQIPKTDLVYFDDILKYYDCSNDSTNVTPPDTRITSEDVNFTILDISEVSAYNSKHGKVLKVINTQSEYEEEYAKYSSEIPESVDFNEFKVILTYIGNREALDYSRQILYTSKDVEGNTHVYLSLTTGKGDNCSYPDILSNPYVFAKIPKGSDVYFNDEVHYYECDN